MTGRATLSAREMRFMLAAEQVVQAHHSRARATDWATWAEDNKFYAWVLAEAMSWATK